MELVSLQYLIYYNIKLFFKGSHQSPRHHGRNKFQSITDLPIAPLSIPAWSMMNLVESVQCTTPKTNTRLRRSRTGG